MNLVLSLQLCLVYQNIGQLLTKKTKRIFSYMEWFIQLQLQQATKQCLTKTKEFPHVHVWADTRALFFKTKRDSA